MSSATKMLFRRLVLTNGRFLAAKNSASLKNVTAVTPKNFSTSQSSRSGHDLYGWAYRTAHPPPRGKIYQILPDVIVGFIWWWIFWNLLTEPGHVFGEFPDVEPSKFTDEELGIPSDDADV